MEEQIGNAVTVMLVGMCTVISILALVVFSGKILISVLNATGFMLNRSDNPISTLEDDKLAKNLVTKAISKWSGGKATPVSIKRIK